MTLVAGAGIRGRESISSERIRVAGVHLVVAVEISLLFLIFRLFSIEQSSGINRIAPLIVAGFLVHAALPMGYRKPFFLALSAASFGMIAGPAALFVFAAGLLMLGVCHLPVRFSLRVVILLAMGAALAAFVVTGPRGSPADIVRKGIPLLASAFMFRLFIYMYDLRHERGDVSVWTRLTYFFLVPNASFILFPVIDFQAFRRTYYNRPTAEIYQRGARLILRGITHLLAYRFVYYFLTPAPIRVDGVSHVALFIVSAWLLFLRVSGVFHTIIGILCLFGFNLPESNRLYFLASSPNEIWRRANIYWKDFMVKVFYLPLYKALEKRRRGTLASVLIATVVVFAVTWMLHSYQWFWLLGKFPLSAADALFWSIFASLVLADTFFEFRRTRKRKVGRDGEWSARNAAIHTLKVMGVFAFMGVMWSWWNTRDTMQWIYMIATVRESGAFAWLLLGVALSLVFAGGVLIHYVGARGWDFGIGKSVLPFRQSMLSTLAASVLIIAAASPAMARNLGPRAAWMLQGMREDRLNERDAEIADRGYYQAIVTAEQPSSVFGPMPRPGFDKPLVKTSAVRLTNDGLAYVLVPNHSIKNRGVMVETNSLGMRDREYSLAKPAGTYRIAMIGGSVSFAAGVEQTRSFEALVEERLNREKPSRTFSSYEILNYSVSGHGLIQYVGMAEQYARQSSPDALVMVTLAAEEARTRDLLAELLMKRAELPPAVVDIARRAGVRRSSRLSEIRRKIATPPYPEEIRRWSYKRIVELCRERNIIPVWAYLPAVVRAERPGDYEPMARDAAAAGFVVLDLRDAYPANRDSVLLRLPDGHPNETGQAYLARAFYSQLIARAPEVGLGDLKETYSTTSRAK